MPTTTPTTPKSNRRGHESEKNRKNKLNNRASSFHGRIPTEAPEARVMRRPSTLPNLLGGRSLSSTAEAPPKLTKLLLNVTIQGSVGAVQVLMSPDSTVGDLISAAIRQYTKEGRRPIISVDPSRFDLHYSQFSLESLNREEKLITLGSRNFFLCPKKSAVDGGNGIETGISSRGGSISAATSSCSNEVEKAGKGSSPWLKFMDFLR
ncbi:uncharacterized protein [Euphorbia lathyris]|uniref:uncharacterized protein n=1 Tax=Euphorbia lathyris TaxID=212925 RepID=UPI003313A27E